jgi:membrane-bound lytic murein transglycosylase D
MIAHNRRRAGALLITLLISSLIARDLGAEEPAQVARVEAQASLTPRGAADDEEQEEAAQDFEEVEELHQLEREALVPTLAAQDSARADLLAPYAGSLAQLRAEQGLVPSLYALPAQNAHGAALTDLPEVRARIEETQVLGQQQIYMHAPVRAYLDFFDGRGKRLLAQWAKRMAIYEPMIRATLREEGLPEDLIFVAMIESGFRPSARSPARAVGMWQFMAGTGRDMGLVIDRHVDERRDPVKSTRAAARYLKKLYLRYDSWPLALAAYNAGPGTVDKEIVRLNSNSYWKLSEQEGIYEEARRYVPKIMAAAFILKHGDVFGLDGLVRPAALEFDVVEVKRGLRLSVVAAAIRGGVDELMELNPELLRATTPPGEGTYTLRVPRGKAAEYVERVDRIVVADGAEHRIHEVRFAETVEQIAAYHGVAPHVLRAVNGIARKGRARMGQALVLPDNALGKWTPPSPQPMEALVPEGAFSYPDRVHYFYEIQRGDTLDALAAGFGANAADLALWNNLDMSAKLRIGMVLQLFLPTPDPEQPVSLALRRADEVSIINERPREPSKRSAKRSKGSKRGKSGREHTVRKGDTVGDIAKRYNVTQEQLERWNPALRRQKFLQLGQKIKLH